MGDLTGRENVYTCRRCGAVLVTVDRDAGVTPMFLTCGYLTPTGCGGMMGSAMYPLGPRPPHVPAPTHEWYRPTEDEAREADRKAPGTLDHVQRGGLLLRAIPTPRPAAPEGS